MERLVVCENQAQHQRYSYTCETHTPPQCSLCYDSKVCVLRRDHHCVFFGQCVGFRNYHYFLSCLLFMWTGLLYTVVVNTGLHHHPEGRSHAAQHPATTHALDHALWLDWEGERGRVYVQRESKGEPREREKGYVYLYVQPGLRAFRIIQYVNPPHSI